MQKKIIQICRELNIGLQTATDLLSRHPELGEVRNDPGFKLTDGQCALLRNSFSQTNCNGTIERAVFHPLGKIDLESIMNRSESARANVRQPVVRKTKSVENPRPHNESSELPIKKLANFNPRNNQSFNDVIRKLADICLSEVWDFGASASSKYKVLEYYLNYTCMRLQYEDRQGSCKLKKSKDGSYMTFNTGLVDKLYEPIYMVFKQNPTDSRQPWCFHQYACSTEGSTIEWLKKTFGSSLPDRARYHDEPADLVYDDRLDIEIGDWTHLVEHLERYPEAFLKRVKPDFDFNREHTEEFRKELTKSIREDSASYRTFKTLIEQAKKDAIKRVLWNFKTAIPIYYPRTHKISLLLPLFLEDENNVSVAMVLEKGDDSYFVPTVLDLEMAYIDARLIARPDSDWLILQNIQDN